MSTDRTMFVSQARSITQQSRLAITLAWIAGYTNIITLILCSTATSHISGTLSQWGRDLVEGKWSLTIFTSYLLVTFLAGAIFSGLCTEGARRQGWQSIYVLPMAFQMVLLAVFAILVELHARDGTDATRDLYQLTGVASFAMGLQNATITRISGGVVRTTHMTGVFTDLGLEMVHLLFWVRDRLTGTSPGNGPLLPALRRQNSAMRVVLLISVAGSFALGAGLGAAALATIPTWAMFPPVIFLLWIIYQDIRIPISAIMPADVVVEDMGLPQAMAVFHIRRKSGTLHRAERLPDLHRWVERLSPDKRIVILDFGESARIDEDAALELAAMIKVAMSRGIHIILAGITSDHYSTMQLAGAGAMLDVTNVCTDLELAIARGFAVLSQVSARRG
jgi:uncharacterized membrane protein YoaK (UPF0700 family)/anti-anti-sigma regulatory factor